jgi:hypothetical protein
VLPFANLSGDPEQDYFSDGITEGITTELSRFSELLVIGRNSAFQYKGKALDLRQIWMKRDGGPVFPAPANTGDPNGPQRPVQHTAYDFHRQTP